jgi:hypothetical protein
MYRAVFDLRSIFIVILNALKNQFFYSGEKKQTVGWVERLFAIPITRTHR